MGRHEGIDAVSNTDGKCKWLVYSLDLIASHHSPERASTETKFLSVSQIIWSECFSRKILALE